MTIKEGINGLPVCVATNSKGASVEGYAYGAHVTSWKDAKGEELLFVSKKAIFAPPKAIRGGIPVCLPQFAKLGPLQQHGFARNVDWEVVDDGASTKHGEAGFCMRLMVDDALAQKYNFDGKFVATLWAGLSEGGDFVQVLEVDNRDEKALELTCALHTYFRVGDVSRVRVTGLAGCSYKDSVDGGAIKEETGQAVDFVGEVDRVYMNVAGPIMLEDGAAGRSLSLHMEGFMDSVVWNQWADKSAAMADFGDEEYKEYVCIEAAVAASGPLAVQPGQTWVGKQVVKVLQQ